MSVNHDKVNSFIKDASGYIGLTSFNPQLMEHHSLYREYSLGFLTKLKLAPFNTIEEVIMETFNNLKDNIHNSEFVQNKLKAKDAIIKNLEEKVKELEKYETYYIMQYKLNCGKENK